MGDESRALRRIAADMAQLDIEDVQAIFAELAAPSRSRMVALIAGFKAGALKRPEGALEPSASPYSPWLETRLARMDPSGLMTDQARAALRRLAAESGWTGAARPTPRAKGFAAILGRVQ
ncbi:hypothetical protein GCM10017620_31350 [Brevundimonas intermedia]|uniref:Uncharacterized protein n=1 Tax=Brevundimonas intermedia TaxID=74315 RepID=A0ABQ5TCY0_9CAUL|nr:hypothetical protein [Brevundimonas intermedia]GLK50161.1 hypothetical protein GCM10017620_31350 [Brevundimonas intermedia]